MRKNINKVSGILILSLVFILSFSFANAQTPPGFLTRQLDEGARGEDVRLLQQILASDPTIYPENLVTGYFGPLTARAVRAFQERNGIDTVGRVGPRTLSKVNEFIGGGSVTSATLAPASTDQISPTNESSVTPPVSDTSNEAEVIISFVNMPGRAEEALVRTVGGVVGRTYRTVPAIAARVPQQALLGLSRNPNIRSIEPDVRVRIHDLELDNTWGVKRVGAGTVHSTGNTGATVRVAVIDTGIDYNHPELRESYAGGYNFVANTNNPFDDHGHGTHVAGTIASAKDGVGVVGTAPDVRIYALKVLDANGSGRASDLIAAIEWALDNGIAITNNSYGSDTNLGSTVSAAFRNAETQGILHVAAAGNSGTCAGGEDSVSYPAKYDAVIAVGVINKSDSRTCFSSTGPALELVSPGVSINSTRVGGGYIEYTGTSMGAPHVSGSAALVMAAGIADSNNNGRINDEVRSFLRMTAYDLGPSGFDYFYGYGLVQPDTAISTALSGSLEPEDEETDTANDKTTSEQNQLITPPFTLPLPHLNLPAPALQFIPSWVPGLRRMR